MLVSLNKIKQYTPVNIPTDKLIQLIGSRLVEVEGSTDLAPKYQGIKVVKVVSAEPIPDTHLTLCQIDCGKPETVQVVCGAPNVHQGMLAAWIMPGSVVPSTYGDEDFKLDVRKLRGYESHGMLAAADELDLGGDHDGIIEINPHDAQPGDDFAEVFDLNDVILDIENKSLTHRPDCFGLIGFAREVAGILGQKFEEPRQDGRDDACPGANDADLKIKILDDTLCPRYSCAVLDCAKLLDHPKYFTKQDALLAKLGMRPVSPIVDLTNVLMLETGQPLHAFDYDKFVAVGGAKDPQIIVRPAREGETLQLLDGKTIECVPTDILITSNDVPVALAGAMGGASTEIDASSRKIILESATFSLYNLRKTQMAHGIFSEAITRFTKGQPAAQTLPVLEEAIRRLDTAPLAIADAYPNPAKPVVVKTTTEAINNLLGTTYDTNLITKTLENVGFKVKCGAALEVTAPLWRTDIHLPEDITEEVGRLLGFDNIPLAFPLRPTRGADLNPLFDFQATLRRTLSGKLAAHEALTYSFVSENLLTQTGLDPTNAYHIVNSISPELQCFRPSITPSLISKIRTNLKAGYQDFTLYEINQIAQKSDQLDQDGVPIVRTHLSIVTLGDYYKIKAIAKALFQDLHRQVQYTPFSSTENYPFFEPAHSVSLQNPDLPGDIFGAYGEIKPAILRRFKLEGVTVSALELDVDQLMLTPGTPAANFTSSKFPPVSRDLTFAVPDSTTFGQLSDTLQSALASENLIYALTPTSIFQKSPDDPTRNISFHLEFASPATTLHNSEISAIIEKITQAVAALGAEIV